MCPNIEVYAQKGLCLLTVCPKGTCLLTGCLKGNFKQYALWLDALKGILSNMPYDWMPRREMPFDRMPIYCTAELGTNIFFLLFVFNTYSKILNTHCILFESLFIELLESGLNLGLASSWIIVTKSNKKVLVWLKLFWSLSQISCFNF